MTNTSDNALLGPTPDVLPLGAENGLIPHLPNATKSVGSASRRMLGLDPDQALIHSRDATSLLP